MKAEWASYTLDFKFLARTSRESMRQKQTYFVRIGDRVGECALFRGLSADDLPDYEEQLSRVCENPDNLSAYSSIRFGFETAMMPPLDDSPFMRGEEGIPINGLIWMGDREEMRRRIDEKLTCGFSVLKMKIGGIDFEQEVDLLRYIRSRYSSDVLELRLDANGSFSPDIALERLKRLSDFDIHSIEQPIRVGQALLMSQLCKNSPIAIALDEELIGTPTADTCENLLEEIRPQFIILKPALCGGLSGATLWADVAESKGIGWWATSALESNIGLMAIARWVSSRGVSLPQGLGTGQLYTNNIPSPLYLNGDRLFYNPEGVWQIPDLQWHS